jgi:hypothetical protein
LSLPTYSTIYEIAKPVQPAAPFVTSQHPEIVSIFGGGVDKALAVGCYAEANTQAKVQPHANASAAQRLRSSRLPRADPETLTPLLQTSVKSSAE